MFTGLTKKIRKLFFFIKIIKVFDNFELKYEKNFLAFFYNFKIQLVHSLMPIARTGIELPKIYLNPFPRSERKF